VRGLGLFFGMELRLDDQPACIAAEDILYHSLSDGLSYKIGGGARHIYAMPCFNHYRDRIVFGF
jgi:hypothetical protein